MHNLWPWLAGSTLLFHGREALHALQEFLMNARVAATPYFLTLQLLAPQPFLHGSPYSPRLVFRAGRRRNSSAEGGDRGEGSAAGGENSLGIEEAERGGPALLLPRAVHRLTALLCRTQADGFQMVLESDAGGAASDALNLRLDKLRVHPRDIGKHASTRPQPRARTQVAGGGGPDERAPPLAESGALEDMGRPRCLRQARFSEGELSVVVS